MLRTGDHAAPRAVAYASTMARQPADDRTKQIILLGVLRGLSIDDALKEMEFTPLIAEQVEELSPSTPEELRILREEINLDRAIIGAAGE